LGARLAVPHERVHLKWLDDQELTVQNFLFQFTSFFNEGVGSQISRFPGNGIENISRSIDHFSLQDCQEETMHQNSVKLVAGICLLWSAADRADCIK
jgi:hypothetical protein